MKRIVVDTNIVIDYLFKKIVKDRNLKILLPAVCLTELYVGKSAARHKEEAGLKRAVGKIKLISADKNISRRAGVLMRDYPNLYLGDALVAATALEEKASLCTFNRSHFEGISDLDLFSYGEYIVGSRQ